MRMPKRASGWWELAHTFREWALREQLRKWLTSFPRYREVLF